MIEAAREVDGGDGCGVAAEDATMGGGGGGGVAPANNDINASSSCCAFCGCADLHVVDGNVTCVRCNTIAGRLIDLGAEWRYYGAEDSRSTDPTRCCPPSNDLIPTLGCVIGRGGGGGASKAGGPLGSAPPSMVQKYQIWNSMTYRERTLCGVFDVLSVNAAQFGISPCILEEAKALYKRVTEAKITRGENRSAIIACCLYMACKSNKVPRSIKEIAAMFNVRVGAMTKGCRMLEQIVDIKAESSTASDFVRRFCSRLGIPPHATAVTQRIVDRADEYGVMCDSTPPSVVAGAIWMANTVLKLGVSKKEVAEACLISQGTVSKCYKRLAECQGVLMDESV